MADEAVTTTRSPRKRPAEELASPPETSSANEGPDYDPDQAIPAEQAGGGSFIAVGAGKVVRIADA